MHLIKKPRTPYTAGRNYQPLVGFYASDINKIKLDNQIGGHIYYIINLRNMAEFIKYHKYKNYICEIEIFENIIYLILKK